MEKMYTPQEVAKILHVRPSTVYMLIHSKQLGSIKLGSRYKIPDYCLEDWVRKEVEA